jgi:hypothetical protein
MTPPDARTAYSNNHSPEPGAFTIGKLKVKWIGRYDPGPKWLRLCRIMWRFEAPGYRRKISITLCRCLFRFERDYAGWMLTLLFVRLCYERAYWGLFS